MPADPTSAPDSAPGAETDAEAVERHVESRAELLPEERAAGSDDPQAQAEAILAESLERTEHPDADASSQSRQATSDVAEVITGIEERGVLPQCDAVLSGYQGAEEVGEVVLDAVARVKAANPAAVYCCDPVMGAVGRGFFVREGIPEYMRDHVVPKADIVTPNQFELEFLVGREVATQADLVAAARELVAHGPAVVLVTSALTSDTPEGSIQVACITADD